MAHRPHELQAGPGLKSAHAAMWVIEMHAEDVRIAG